MARRSRPVRRAMTGGGSGFIFPPFSVTFSGAGFAQGSDQASVAGALTVLPADASLTLLDSDGGKFQLDGTNVEAGATLTSPTDSTAQPITVRQLWGGRTVDTVLSIPLIAQSVALSGSHSLAHTAAANTVVGALSAVPSTSVTFSITAQDVTSGFKIVGTSLERDTGTLTAGTYNITIRATKGAQHWDQAFALTLT